MMNRRNLAQNMAAQGLSGGASETTLAGLANNYGNARNAIQTTANENLGNLENLYSQNKNSAQQAYNNQLASDELQRAQYMVQFENDRQNALAQAYESQLKQLMSLSPEYLSGMSGLVDSQGAYSPTDQGAPINSVKSVSVEQGTGSGVMNSYYANLARQRRQEGYSDEDIARELATVEGLANNSILTILNQLG